MFKLPAFENMTRDEKYDYMLLSLKNQIDIEKDELAILANSSALLEVFVERINWAGYYLLKDNELVLGPFQGLPACTRIQMGKGVVGKCAELRETILVPDVYKFEDHIFCDSNSRSEICIPIFQGEELFGVLDVDSPEENRFDDIDEKFLKKFIKIIEENLLDLK